MSNKFSAAKNTQIKIWSCTTTLARDYYSWAFFATTQQYTLQRHKTSIIIVNLVHDLVSLVVNFFYHKVHKDFS